ncbi:hypothetical protein A2U01_0026227 [Trifolium medium]|uniref:Uncharacterized protein n=1 Tax=Trifolium medium TaxID=97028 RepID=A0A392NZH6_9FABA|nr:hypothetical protein [Trifolium medium]
MFYGLLPLSLPSSSSISSSLPLFVGVSICCWQAPQVQPEAAMHDSLFAGLPTASSLKSSGPKIVEKEMEESEGR